MPPSICDLKSGETALDALTGMASLTTIMIDTAQQVRPLSISYLTDHPNYSVYWTRWRLGEPPYRPSYPEAIAALCAREISAAKRQVLATDMMDSYFTVGVHPLPVNDADAQNALRNLMKQTIALADLRHKVTAKTISFSDFCRSATDIATELARIGNYLLGLDPSMKAIPCISRSVALCLQVIDRIKRLPKVVPANDVVSVIRESVSELKVSVDALASIMIGYATVTNNESIPQFFLMRLLVGYRLKLATPEDKLYVSIASAQLTALLHNQQAWLQDLMQAMIADLAYVVNQFGNDVCFFLKGGRGLNYLLGTPGKGENDWDTQILINPDLSYRDWWTLYYDVRKAVNNRLLRYNFVFSANLTANAPTLIAATKSVADAFAKNPSASDQTIENIFTLVWQRIVDDEALGSDPEITMALAWQASAQQPSGNCKAELIDVGLPRFYTIELLEQWKHVRQTIAVTPDGIPYPTAPYFIDELIAMVRETDANVSPSPSKRPRRLSRLLSLLLPPVTGFSSFLKFHQTLVADAKLALTSDAISKITNEQICALVTIMLGQFCIAYRLLDDPHFAGAFDRLSSSTLGDTMKNAGASSAEQQADLAFKWCQAVSTITMAHLAERGQYVLGQTNAIAALVSQLAGAKPAIAPIIDGSFAICLHDLWLGSPTKCKVGPPECATITLLFQDCASASDIPSGTLQQMASKIEGLISASACFGSIAAYPQTMRIAVFAKQSLALAGGSYQPLLVQFTIRASAQVPTLTRGNLTLLDLPVLTIWCRHRAADVTEWAMRRTWNETFGALIEMETAVWAAAKPVRARL